MKQLPLESTSFQYLERSFKEWLQVLGYAGRTADSLPVHVREFFHYLEQRGIKELPLVENRHVQGFIIHLDNRVSDKTGMGLSASSRNKIITAVNAFIKYINASGKHFLDINPVRPDNDIDIPVVLTPQEIKQLYDASFDTGRVNKAIGQRDRAMLAVFYGCGLRKEEGTRLNITDIDTVKGLLFVRKGKGNKQRYVPIARQALEDIKVYLKEGRNWFFEQHDGTGHWQSERYGLNFKRKVTTADEAFFINRMGQRMSNFYQRLHLLRDKAGIEKEFGLHILRHSIATHLLQSGMDIEEIAKFLGHGSLLSTQLYTHIINDKPADNGQE
ncbi:integrase/recombinase XerD [Filimonas lacunae]|uniref:Integrase/recombinase XerD n=1 Tax=Filimonas lacunae TaxID=477680 RepID=A0A173MFG7_9BACT|nr:tyrosine-type recombinase/integrase [Filimonas lacunae]BAV06181.1 integrase family protein [Filimonas lacunae]SIT25132.1 integrase/recombinase XerD [Filimonas lacunae]